MPEITGFPQRHSEAVDKAADGEAYNLPVG